MTTLYKRATPSQKRMLQIIEGAVHNAMDAHSVPRDQRMARSIAKRAAGTLSSQWKEVLAVNTKPSAKGTVSHLKCGACERRASCVKLKVRKERAAYNESMRQFGRGVPHGERRSPLLTLWDRLKREMWQLRRTDLIKFEARVELLRMIDKLQKQIEGSNP